MLLNTFVFSGGLADHQIQHDRVPGAADIARRRGSHLLPLPNPEPPPSPAPQPAPLVERERQPDRLTNWLWKPPAAGFTGIGRAARWVLDAAAA